MCPHTSPSLVCLWIAASVQQAITIQRSRSSLEGFSRRRLSRMATSTDYLPWLLLLTGMVMVHLSLVQANPPCDKKSFITFNTFLTNKFINYAARSAAITKALREKDVDVICLQEVYHEKDMAAIIDGVKDAYPYHFSPLHQSANRLRASDITWKNLFLNQFLSFVNAPCKLGELLRLGLCLMTTCRGLTDRDLYECLLLKCPDAVFKMRQECRTCLILSDQSLTGAMVRCLDSLSLCNRFNTHGLMLLSKHPITSAQWFPYVPDTAQILPRAYMLVTMETVGRVICTHLTSDLGPDYIEFNLRDRYSSYEEQQRGEIELLNNNFSIVSHVLLGDLNTGPSDPSRNLSGLFPDNYARLKQLGYVSVYEENGGQCTLCDFENYNMSSFIVDHVLSKTFTEGTSQRVLETYEGLPLSDHYGVQVDACLGPMGQS